MRPRALIVEDDRATRDILRTLLEGEGVDVDSVSDGEAALEHLRTEQYTLLLLDVVLPTISGIDVMNYVQTHNPSLLPRTIVVSGLDVVEIRKVFPTVIYALAKPVLPARLRAAIRASVHQADEGAADAFIVA